MATQRPTTRRRDPRRRTRTIVVILVLAMTIPLALPFLAALGASL